MTHIHNDRTSRQRRRAGTTLVLAAATGGLLAAAMAGSPTARADDLADIVTDVQNSITIGEGDFSDASADFSAGDTDEGLFAAFAGFDNTFIAPMDYTLVGLTGEVTGTDISVISGFYNITDLADPAQLTSAGETADATSYTADASIYSTAAETLLSSGVTGDYTLGVFYLGYSELFSVLAEQATILASVF